MKGLELVRFFVDKKEHYPISDGFIEGYQQRDDGSRNSYITFAHETEHLVDAKKHEPNQKWHLLEACYLCRLADNNNADMEIKGFKCPELLLWMAEAAGVKNELVIEAEKHARDRIDEIRSNNPDQKYSSEAVKYMDNKLKEKYGKNLWSMIIEEINGSNA